MNQLITLFCALLLAGSLNLCRAQAGNDKILVGVFDGRTPCSSLARLLKEEISAECIKIKWRLTLYTGDTAANTGTYEMLGFVYKKEKPRTGSWQITKGSKADPDAIVYELNETGKEPIFLLKGDDNVFFFLDNDKNLLVGNRDFSYTLNRVGPKNAP